MSFIEVIVFIFIYLFIYLFIFFLSFIIFYFIVFCMCLANLPIFTVTLNILFSVLHYRSVHATWSFGVVDCLLVQYILPNLV